MGKYSGGLILKYIFVKNAITSGLRFPNGVIYGYNSNILYINLSHEGGIDK